MSNEMKDWMAENERETGNPYQSRKTNYENLKSMPFNELAEFLDKFVEWDNTPWSKWFGKTFCQGCEPVEYNDHIWARCELDDEKYPCRCGNLHNESTLEIIKNWLRAEMTEE